MNTDSLRLFFAWSSVINICVLIYWFTWLTTAADYVYSIHSRYFKMSKDQFYVVHYRGILYYKIAIFLFNVVPYIALRIVGWRAGT